MRRRFAAAATMLTRDVGSGGTEAGVLHTDSNQERAFLTNGPRDANGGPTAMA
jgi:hypothetical protein